MNIQALFSGLMPEPTRETFTPIAHDALNKISSFRMKLVAQSIIHMDRAKSSETPNVPMGHNYQNGLEKVNSIGMRAVKPEAVISMPEKPEVVAATTPDDKIEVEHKNLLASSANSDHQAWVDLLSQEANRSARTGEEAYAHITETTKQY